MSRKAPLALIALAVLFGLWLILDRSDSEPGLVSDSNRSGMPSAGVLPVGAEAGLGAVESGPRREAVNAEAAPDASSMAAAAGTPVGLRFRGRCLTAEDGTPLSGVLVTLGGSQANAQLEAEYGPTVWESPEPITTGADGVFEFDTPIALAYQFYLSCAKEGRLTRSARWSSRISAGTVLDLGEVEMMRGYRVHGLCQDASGAPVEAIVRIRSLPMPIEPDMGAGDTASARSGANGVFEFTTAIPPGVWPLAAELRGWMLEEPDTLQVPEFEAPPPLVVTMRALPFIEGWVFDDAGAPVVRAKVEVRQRRGNYIESSYSKEDGSFMIYQRNRDGAPVNLFVVGDEIQEREFPGLIEWGTRGVKLVVERSRSFPIRVIERVSGAAVEDFAIRRSENANGQPSSGYQLQAPHPGGLAEVGGLRNGLNYVIVIPTDPALVPSVWIELDTNAAAEEPLTIALDRLHALEVVVRLRDGTPVAGSNLRVFDRPLAHDSAWVDARSTSREVFGTGLYSQLLAAAVSDASGNARLFAPEGSEELFVDAHGEHLPTTFSLVRPFEQAPPIELLVSLGASIRGTVIVPEDATARYSVSIRSVVDGQEFGLTDGRGFREALPKDGSFSFQALEPGTYRLYLACFSRMTEPSGGSSSSWIHLDDPLVEVTLAADDERVYEFTPPLPECAATARFLLDGLPMAKRPVALSRTPRDLRYGNWLSYGTFFTDGDGFLQISGLQPGTYHATVLVDAADGRQVELLSSETAEIVPGTVNHCEFHFRRITVKVQVVADENGSVLAGWTSAMSSSERAPMALSQWASEPLMWTTDPAGMLSFEVPQPGTFRLSAFKDQILRHSDPFTITQDPPTEPIVLRMKLPEPR